MLWIESVRSLPYQAPKIASRAIAHIAADTA